jgi:hypothetical protein
MADHEAPARLTKIFSDTRVGRRRTHRTFRSSVAAFLMAAVSRLIFRAGRPGGRPGQAVCLTPEFDEDFKE